MEHIELRVEQRAGVAIEREMRAVFGVAGGTIGRGGQNKLVLTDAAAGVARVHAMVRLESNGAHIANLCERRPMYVDEREVRSGEEVPLQPGALIGIGPYVLRAVAVNAALPASAPPPAAEPARPSAAAAPAVAPGEGGDANLHATPSPWSDIPQQFGDATPPRRRPAGAWAALEYLVPPTGAAGAGAVHDNPFAMLGRVESPAPAPVSVPPPAGGAAPVPAAPPAPATVGAPTIPDDFDPLDPFARGAAQQARRADPWAGGLPALGLGDMSPQQHDDLLRDLAPAPAHGQLDDAAHPGLPASLDPQVELDPLKLFAGTPALEPLLDRAAALPHGPELGQLFALPAPAPARADVAAELAASAPEPAEAPPPAVAAPVPAAVAAAPAAPQGPARTGASEQQLQQLQLLVAAFLEGAGLPPQRAELDLTADFMRDFGRCLRVAVQGTIDLLAARAEIKKELRAGVTIISSGANNPLKFLPTADGVLLQMTGQHFPGFMQPVPAMQEAYGDLRVHQVALLAGIRAAYSEALTRFDPAVVEQRAATGLLARVSATGRKAALWDSYSQGYAALRRHAEDDLSAFSGRTFVDAYEAAALAAGGSSR